MDSLLEVKNLKTYFYQGGLVIPAVDDVSFFLNKNSILGVVGESGCGKTMTALSLTGLLPKLNCRIISGSVSFAGQDLLTLDEEKLRKIRGKEISYIFQEPSTSLNPVLTIKAQFCEVLRFHRRDISSKFLVDFIVQQLKEVGMTHAEKKINFYPHQLSGGEKQRIMIAMAMSSRPKLLIADEPTTALDVTIQAQILELLENLKKEFGLAILFISHDLNVVGSLADYLAVMYAGQIVEFSKVEALIKNPRHPYTEGLMGCLLEENFAKKSKLKTIPGEVPRAGNFPKGCRFHLRCPKKFEPCSLKMPPLFKLEENQEVRCWLYLNSLTPQKFMK